jgi:hypothetical protein
MFQSFKNHLKYRKKRLEFSHFHVFDLNNCKKKFEDLLQTLFFMQNEHLNVRSL